MRIFYGLFILVVVLMIGVSPTHAGCPYDHFLLGQDGGQLFLDTWQVYRHWNADWETNLNPYGQQYYEFTEMYGGGYIRVEPGFGENENPTYALTGTQGVDYNIVVERVYATPSLELYDDLMAPILQNDGDTFTLSDYANHHVHVRYFLPDGLDPAAAYTVRYRLTDTTGTYADSQMYSVNLGAVPEPATICLLGIGGMALFRRRFRPDRLKS